MNEKEMRELDAWIAENVLGYRRTDNPDDYTTDNTTLFWHRNEANYRESVLIGKAYTHSGLTKQYGKEMFSHSWTHYCPTTDSAAALEVLKKCAEKMPNAIVGIGSPMGKADVISTLPKTAQGWVVGAIGFRTNAFDAEAPTLELAICLFAKKLFEK
jgi:hypothetical protein